MTDEAFASISRDLVRSTGQFSWAMMLFAVQQFSYLLGAASVSEAATQSTSSLARVIREMDSQLRQPFKNAFRAGDQAQRGLVDFGTDGDGRSAVKTGFEAARAAAEAFASMLPANDGQLPFRELESKLLAFNLFEHVDTELKIPRNRGLSLTELIARTSGLDPFSVVWATEGLGHFYTEQAWSKNLVPRALLKNVARSLPASSLIPLHAGLGLSVATRLLSTVGDQPTVSELRNAVERFVAICEDNAQGPLAQVSIEALGLAARTLYPQLTRLIDLALRDANPAAVPYFWHGVGRGLYFCPTHFVPLPGLRGRAIRMALEEPPHDIGCLNAAAGIAWAITLVNIRCPACVADVLARNSAEVEASPGFRNGVGSALAVWQCCSPRDEILRRFCEYKPTSSDCRAAAAWDRNVRVPCITVREAFGDEDPENLAQLFRFQPVVPERESISVAEVGRGFVSESNFRSEFAVDQFVSGLVHRLSRAYVNGKAV
jgi:hypothetical protein